MDLSQIPPEALSHIPVGAPPPGVIPNFENPPSEAKLIIIISTICLCFMIPIALIRVYSRIWITRSFGWDDGKSAEANLRSY